VGGRVTLCLPALPAPFEVGLSIVGEVVRLCPVVQGVEFTVVEQGVSIRALILRDALEAFFGADESPPSWLKAYESHRDTIDCAAADRHRLDPSQNVVVLRAQDQEDSRLLSRNGRAR
jgi:hypothetical protein